MQTDKIITIRPDLVDVGVVFSSQDGPPEKKYHLESGLNQRDEATCGFRSMLNPTEARTKSSAGGVSI